MVGSQPGIARCVSVLALALASIGCQPELGRVFRGVRAGAELRVPSDRGLVYQVAAAPGGPRACVLIALDARGAELARDEASGPLGMPKLRAPTGTHVLKIEIAAELDRTEGVRVYVNDPSADHDGDGLGRELERALGTCDDADQPGCQHAQLRDYYRSAPRATRDSDRDGLSDGDELFGVAGEPLLDLPRFGVDPRHKDVLVEIDRGKTVEAPGISEEDLAAVAALFEDGSALVLRNPDGRRGIAVHFDAGFDPKDASHAGLFGDWGGSGLSSHGDYKLARKESFSKARQHYFRYAVLARSSFGQSSGDALVINRDGNRVALLAHELAHTLGLKHEGHPSWGALNCKPNHRSIINYVFQNQPEVGFSTQRGQRLNPIGVEERGFVPGCDVARLREPPFELDASEQGVDWNRDGVLSALPVRAGLTWATYKSCMAGVTGKLTLAETARAATPALVGARGDVHAFWIDPTGALAHRRAAIASRCTERACATLARAETVAGLTELRHIAAAKLAEGWVALAHVSTAGDLSVSVLELSGNEWVVRSSQRIAQEATHDAPAIAARAASLIVLYRMNDGRLVQAIAADTDRSFELRQVVDHDRRAIFSAVAPGALTLGTDEVCGAFPDLESFIRFYCYDDATSTWHDLSGRAFHAGLGPQTGGPVGLAYHRYRHADADAGAVTAEPTCEADVARGAVYMSFTEAAPNKSHPDNPNLLISTALDRDASARYAIDFRWRGSLLNQWARIEQGRATALYDDPTLPGLVAALPARADGDAVRIELLPAADGVFDAELGAGNDFAVMERGICTGIRSSTWCGGAKTAAY
jgi:hypothetical protein